MCLWYITNVLQTTDVLQVALLWSLVIEESPGSYCMRGSHLAAKFLGGWRGGGGRAGNLGGFIVPAMCPEAPTRNPLTSCALYNMPQVDGPCRPATLRSYCAIGNGSKTALHFKYTFGRELGNTRNPSFCTLYILLLETTCKIVATPYQTPVTNGLKKAAAFCRQSLPAHVTPVKHIFLAGMEALAHSLVSRNLSEADNAGIQHGSMLIVALDTPSPTPTPTLSPSPPLPTPSPTPSYHAAPPEIY